ncbi:MAG: CPBP family intramembrane metalloprotease [Desulfobacterales bacterium]|nr:CPBP family intramembrane metalloprotease [Desulfobacterales bacterium]
MRKWDIKSGLTVFFLRSVLGWLFAMLFGAAGLVAARLFNLAALPAALWTLGLFGLAGGAALARLLHSSSGQVHRYQYLRLAVIWALCAIGGAFPLFFTMGTRPEMAIRTFYSFAAFGAMGGALTAGMFRSIFRHYSKNDLLPSTLIWSLSFGLAAVTGDAAGEWLQGLLPSSLAWPIAIVMMTIIMGFGSGWSLLQFFKSDQGGWRALQMSTLDDASPGSGQKLRFPWVLIILCLPFYLNDLSNIFIKDWRWWLFIDYASVKLFPFLVILYLIRKNILRLNNIIGPWRPSVVSFLPVVVVAALTVLFIEQNGPLHLKKLFPNNPLGSIPEISKPLWKWIDLSTGLLMVGIFEEVVFRGHLLMFLRQYTCRPTVFILFSAVTFGLIHWSGGLHQIILASAAGAVFMLLYLRTYSLPAVIMSHFIVNFVNLAGVIPPSLFSFFSVPPIR